MVRRRCTCDDGRTMSNTPTLDAPAAGRPDLPGGPRTRSGAPPATPRIASSAASPPAWPRTSASRCCGCGRRSWSRRRSVVRASRCTPASGWCCPPTRSSPRSAPGLESASRRGARPRRVRRLVDAGPAIALGALGFGLLLIVQGVPRRGCRVLAAADRDRRHRAAVAAGRRGAARAVGRQTGRIDPVRMVFGVRQLAGRRPGRRRRPPDRAGHRRLRAPRGPDGRRPQHPAVGRRRLPRPGDRHRPVDLPAGRRPDRGARRAGAHPGARRHGRPPARLGAADPGPDPEERPRLGRASPASPAPRSATCAPGCSRARATTPSTLAGALRGVAAEVEDNHGVDVDLVCVGDCPFTERLRAAGQRHPRGPGQRGQARGHRQGRRVRRGDRRPRSRSSSATAGVGFDPDDVAGGPDRRPRAASSTGWTVTAARPRSGRRPARAPRCACACPARSRRRSTMAEPAQREGPGRHRRRPRDVPGRRQGRAR